MVLGFNSDVSMREVFMPAKINGVRREESHIETMAKNSGVSKLFRV